MDVDYQLVHAEPLTLVGTPMAVTVTLLSDGVAGEGSETIILTLIQSPGTPSNQNQILEYETVMITVADSDCTCVQISPLLFYFMPVPHVHS